MSYLKTLTNQDVIITPFGVNKGLSFIGRSVQSLSPYGVAVYGTASYGQEVILGDTLNQAFIDRFLAVNTPEEGFFNTVTEPTTGYFSTQYQKLVYGSIKQLYYSNWIVTGKQLKIYL